MILKRLWDFFLLLIVMKIGIELEKGVGWWMAPTKL
jgi:hypothetical protein